jgi:hypothetical protein
MMPPGEAALIYPCQMVTDFYLTEQMFYLSRVDLLDIGVGTPQMEPLGAVLCARCQDDVGSFSSGIAL